MKIKLPLIPTIFTIAAVIILCGLGSWQVQRLLWKNNLIAQIDERVKLPPVKLNLDNIDLDKLKYRKVIVTGNFLHEKEIHLFTGAREMRGDPGYNIFTPLVQNNGAAILIDRGWVPAKLKERETRPESLLAGKISITGMLHSGERQAMFTPPNDPARNLWFWIDMPIIAGFTGKEMQNVYVRALADASNNDILPIPGETKINLRNDHLEYAIIWYSFAIILLVIYSIYVRSEYIEAIKKSKIKKPRTRKKK